MGTNQHYPVLLKEAIEQLHVKKSAKYIDATVGTGGHAREILERGGRLLGIDMDDAMLAFARKNLSQYGESVQLVRGNFSDVAQIAEDNAFVPCDGVLADLGISSVHYDGAKRGFSFGDKDAVLDMRLETNDVVVTAKDLLNLLSRKQLINLFEPFVGFGGTRKLVGQIVERRKVEHFETVGDFLDVVEESGISGGKLNPATKPFMALRIRVNSELENLAEFLPAAFRILAPKGRLVVISFHSLEDRIVKRFMKANSGSLIVPSREEVRDNPRSRSAKMRVIEKK